jgi:hypothetical protein
MDASTNTATTSAEPAAEAPKPRKTLEPNDIELRFRGDPRIGMAGVPARDLRQIDVDRITYRRTIRSGRGLRRGESGFSEARSKVVRELTATGKFTKRS